MESVAVGGGRRPGLNASDTLIGVDMRRIGEAITGMRRYGHFDHPAIGVATASHDTQHRCPACNAERGSLTAARGHGAQILVHPADPEAGCLGQLRK